MFCAECGAELPDAARFCPQCGKRVGGPGRVPQPRWELCEVQIGSKTGWTRDQYWFDVVTTGSGGRRKLFSEVGLYNDLNDSSRAKNDQILAEVVAKLISDGWEPMPGVPFKPGIFSAASLPQFRRREQSG